MTRFCELRRKLVELFADAGIQSAAVDADLLISELAGVPRSELFFLADQPVPPALEKEIRELARRRAHREPLQYLLGHAYFWELRLDVTPDVLIPRPETELLVEWIVEQLPLRGSVVDLGTGSGAIALSLAHSRPDARITGVDISLPALTVALHNREQLHLHQVEFLESDLFTALGTRCFDLIAANLPYVTPAEYASLEPEVKLHEPALALVAEDEGFALIQRAAGEAPDHLTAGGKLIFELSPHQAERLAGVLKESGAFRKIEILHDYNRRERFVAAERV